MDVLTYTVKYILNKKLPFLCSDFTVPLTFFLKPVCIRSKVKANRFEISPRGKMSLRCKVTWLQAKWKSLRCKFYFGQVDRSEISNRSKISMWVPLLAVKKCSSESFILITSAHVLLKKQPICFASIRLALIKRYHLRICNRILLWFVKLRHWNRYVNRTTFESCLRYQTGFSSLQVSHANMLQGF